jgi:uncharacterized damage-inducible protein DinB
MTSADLQTLLDTYAQGGAKLRQAIAGLSRNELLATPIPGKWSTQTVVLHLADAEAAFADRMRRIIAQDDPLLLAWEENQFTARLMYDEQSADDAATIVDLTRRQMSRVLHKLPPAAFERTGRHSERGPQTLLDVVRFAVAHLDHHLKFVYEKREKMGKSIL